MSLEQQIRDALVQLASSLQQDITNRADSIAAESAKAAREEQMASEAESMSRFAAEIAAVRAEADRRVESESAKVRAEAEETVGVEVATLRAELQRARDEAVALRLEAERTREQLETAAAELAVVRDRAIAAEQTLETERQTAATALDSERQAAATARVEERQGEMAGYDRLIAGVRRIGQGGTLSDVLTALAESAASETSRTAVLVASGEGFRAFSLLGFGNVEPGLISKADVADLTRGLPFAPLSGDRAGFSVPIEVGGQTVAIVYADDTTDAQPLVPSAWPEAIEILARHAALRLETLTALRTVQALGARQGGGAAVATTGVSVAPAPTGGSTTEDDQSARRYARLLVSEIKLYNENAVRLGRQHHDLLSRLRPEIDRARRLYEERVPAHIPARATYFDDELVQTLADGDPGLLGDKR
jgi:hypothetical protein